MNLLLLTESEISGGQVILGGRRAEHLFRVLKAAVGQELKAGVLGKGRGTATVLSCSKSRAVLEVGPISPSRPSRPKTLLLAAPRPKVLSRCLEHATALGFTHIRLFRSRRVDKSHLLSHKATLRDQHTHLIQGLEQSRRVHLPVLSLHERFRPFIEDDLPGLLPDAPRFLAQPDATRPTRTLTRFDTGYSLAIGPEGGFVPFEIEKFSELGFQAVSAGEYPLRVESALSYLTGQLDLLTTGSD